MAEMDRQLSRSEPAGLGDDRSGGGLGVYR